MSESKLDSFSDSQFSIPGYRIVRKNGSKNGEGILFYIHEDKPIKFIENKQLPGNLEILMLETILDKMKILLMELDKPPSFNEKDFLFHLSNVYIYFFTPHMKI